VPQVQDHPQEVFLQHPLAIVELIHLFVEVLDGYFGNVSELDTLAAGQIREGMLPAPQCSAGGGPILHDGGGAVALLFLVITPVEGGFGAPGLQAAATSLILGSNVVVRVDCGSRRFPPMLGLEVASE